MSRIEGKVPSGFSEEPLAGPAFSRALERGEAKAVRRADALAAQHRADAQIRRTAKVDGSPKAPVTVIHHVTQRPTDEDTENPLGIKPSVKVSTQRAAIVVTLPRQHRPRPHQLARVDGQVEADLPPLVEGDLPLDTDQRVWDGEPIDGDQIPETDPFCTEASIVTGGSAAVFGQPYQTPDEVELTEGYADAHEQGQ